MPMDAPAFQTTTALERRRAAVRVRGAVQGVGFRPFVWGLAHQLRLTGWVLNDEDGVLAEIEGDEGALNAFLARLRTEAPPLARIDDVEITTRDALGEDGFTIRASVKSATARTMIPPDAATCEACLDDIFDPENRRHLYAFTNCTHCGPRHTITASLPYDRAQTSMAAFLMCPACGAEYEDPADRRFHAQPNACPECGPQLSMPPGAIAARLKAGEIVAVKGLGGFHLAVDARSAAAVDRLRARKRRDGKPFAVMVANLASAERLVHLDAAERAALTDRARPILIAAARAGHGLAPGVANGLDTLGVMLPYTPLHHLIVHAALGSPAGARWRDDAHDLALVMTSANPGGEPLVIGDEEAHARLSAIADTIVTHDRDILVRSDDSVVRVIAGAPAYLRRARGAAPAPIKLPHEVPPTLAVGGHLKNAVCVTRGDEAFLSQHVGDLDNAAACGFFEETAAHLLALLEVKPERVACDLHPDFHATRFAEDFAEARGLPLIHVQHHHAHIAGVVAEHHLEEPVLGLALDGFGLGADGVSSWGGECLSVEGAAFKRLGHLTPLRQPGGDRAAREVWRMGAAALHALGRTAEIPTRYAGHQGAELLAAMLEKGVNAPETTSAGRLFDAACGLLGVEPKDPYEGAAPMLLESLVREPRVLIDGWRVTEDRRLDMTPLLHALLDRGAREGAELFHGTFAAALADWASVMHAERGGPRVIAAAGGCLQNKVLTEALADRLSARGFALIRPAAAPAGDGGLALGQAWVGGVADPVGDLRRGE